jgi:hypothetical protein
METKVLTQEEITQLKSLQQEKISFIEKFGILEMQLRELETQKTQLTIDYQKFKQNEDKIANLLQIKYGDGMIDLEKGEFTTT